MRVDEHLAGDSLGEDQEGDERGGAAEQPQGERLEAKRPLGRRGEVALDQHERIGADATDGALEAVGIGTGIEPEQQRLRRRLPFRVAVCHERAVERRRREDGRVQPDRLRRELAGRGRDPHDPAAARLSAELELVVHMDAVALRGHEAHDHLVGTRRVRPPPVEELVPVDRGAHPAVGGRKERNADADVRVVDDAPHRVADPRQPLDRGQLLGLHDGRRIVGDGHVPGPLRGHETRVCGVGAAGPGRRRHDDATADADQQRE